jgi:uncharacterized membrane protein
MLRLAATLRAVLRHTPLMLALVSGAVIAAALTMFSTTTPAARFLTAWDGAIAAYLLALWLQTRHVTTAHMVQHAAEADEGRYFVLFVSLAAVTTSLTAIIMALHTQGLPGASATSEIGFVFLTVALSWLFVHASFAKHYAHEYYGPADGGGIREGLIFPGGEEPDFGDFFHFALVIGVANQTADIQISAKPIRRIVTLHGIAAFIFNTVILALAINLGASLFA